VIASIAYENRAKTHESISQGFLPGLDAAQKVSSQMSVQTQFPPLKTLEAPPLFRTRLVAEQYRFNAAVLETMGVIGAEVWN